MGFRSYVREHASERAVLEPFLTHERDDLAVEVVSALLKRHPTWLEYSWQEAG
jgi:ABC-type sugar transport system substrate-binding protein